MFSLLYSLQKDLSEDSIQTVFELLKISSPPDITDFVNNPEGEKDLYDFFFDVLIDNNIPCAIDIDWKWSPEDLFWQLGRYFTKDSLKLIRKEWIEADKCYQIEYTFNGKSEAIEVAFDDPNRLLDSLSRHLQDHKFIALVFFEDRYSWLIVPSDFNTELFCTLTGFAIEKRYNLTVYLFDKTFQSKMAGGTDIDFRRYPVRIFTTQISQHRIHKKTSKKSFCKLYPGGPAWLLS